MSAGPSTERPERISYSCNENCPVLMIRARKFLDPSREPTEQEKREEYYYTCYCYCHLGCSNHKDNPSKGKKPNRIIQCNNCLNRGKHIPNRPKYEVNPLPADPHINCSCKKCEDYANLLIFCEKCKKPTKPCKSCLKCDPNSDEYRDCIMGQSFERYPPR